MKNNSRIISSTEIMSDMATSSLPSLLLLIYSELFVFLSSDIRGISKQERFRYTMVLASLQFNRL